MYAGLVFVASVLRQNARYPLRKLESPLYAVLADCRHVQQCCACRNWVLAPKTSPCLLLAQDEHDRDKHVQANIGA